MPSKMDAEQRRRRYMERIHPRPIRSHGCFPCTLLLPSPPFVDLGIPDSLSRRSRPPRYAARTNTRFPIWVETSSSRRYTRIPLVRYRYWAGPVSRSRERHLFVFKFYSFLSPLLELKQRQNWHLMKSFTPTTNYFPLSSTVLGHRV